MASVIKKQLAVVVFMVCAAAMVKAATEPAEDCKTQRTYFKNCLGRGIREGCCNVVTDHQCLCELEREAEAPCIPGRRCPVSKTIKIAEMDLSCMKQLNCRRA
ncbi:hypothetical protein ABZP36_012714 [Zizania latifolia]